MRGSEWAIKQGAAARHWRDGSERWGWRRCDHAPIACRLERAAETLQRLKAGPSKTALLTNVLLSAREQGLSSAEDEGFRMRWQSLHAYS